VRNLLNLILEAPLDDATAKKMISSNKQVSVYYQGDDKTKKGWIKIEPVRIEGEGSDKKLVAYEIPKEASKKAELKKYTQSKITNWNILGTTPATIAGKEKEKDKKKAGAPPKPPKVVKRNLGAKGQDYCDAITNKRYVKLYYQGDEEESPGWRIDVQPVCYGSKKGIRYIRAWVGSGKSVSGEKSPQKKALPGWRFFREDRIKNWEVDSTKTFNKPPDSRFNAKGDKLLDSVFCISDFAPEAAPGALQENNLLPAILEAVNIF